MTKLDRAKFTMYETLAADTGYSRLMRSFTRGPSLPLRFFLERPVSLGELASSGVTNDAASVGYLDVKVRTRSDVPVGVTIVHICPCTHSDPDDTTVKVSASATVGFCSSGSYYVKTTGVCADGKFPYKVVSVGPLSNPAAQIPTLVCAAPRVPTFLTGYGKWMLRSNGLQGKPGNRRLAAIDANEQRRPFLGAFAPLRSFESGHRKQHLALNLASHLVAARRDGA